MRAGMSQQGRRGISCVVVAATVALALDAGFAHVRAATGSITEFTLHTAGSEPYGMTAGPDGRMWFTEASGNKIGHITTAGKISEVTLPTAGSSPVGITSGPGGAVWFTEENVGQIGRITVSGTVTEFPVPSGGHPLGITAGPDGNLWFTEQGGN